MSLNRKPNFGVRIPVAGPLANPADIARTARIAESLGFDVLWVHDYICWDKRLDSAHISCGSKKSFSDAAGRPDYEPIFFESITNLAFVAGITNKIRLGIAVLVLPYREALVTAKQLACLDVLSNGRLDLGIGQGAAKSTFNTENEVMGISRKTKVQHTREVFEAMRVVWNTQISTYSGDFVDFKDAEVFPKPVQRPNPPIWIGGSAENSLEMIADYADAWLSWGIVPDQFPPALDDIYRRMEKRGRNPDDFVAGTEIQIYLSETVEKARQEVTPTMFAFEEGYAGVTGDKYKPGGVLETMWNSSLIGTSDSVRSEISNYIENGCTAFELKFIYDNVDHLIEQWHEFAENVMPTF